MTSTGQLKQGKTGWVKGARLVLVTAAVLLSAVTFALADIVLTPNMVALETSTGSDTIAIVAGGVTPIPVQYRLQVEGSDGQGGCNASDTTPATATINSDTRIIPLLAGPRPTTGPRSFQWSSCGGGSAENVSFAVALGTPSGTYPVTVTVSDSCVPPNGGKGCGTYNTSIASFNILVFSPDTEAPVISGMPGNISDWATSAGGRSVEYTMPTATDNLDPSPDLTCTPPPLSPFAIGTTPVTCSATDDAGNSSSASFNVEIKDNPPVVTVPADIGPFEGDTLGGRAVTFSASASDVEDGAIAAVCDAESGSVFPVGITTVTCTATDSKPQSASESFMITVTDTTPPAVSVPAGGYYDATGLLGAQVTYSGESAYDIVDGEITPVSCVAASGSWFLGVKVVNCSAEDSHFNVGTNSFVITVHFIKDGYYAPVTMGKLNTGVKGGSTVPLKFKVPAANGDLSVVSGFTAKRLDPCLAEDTDIIDWTVPTTGGTVLRYDASSGQYILNWVTPKNSAGQCWRTRVYLTDGTSIYADFQMK